MGTTLQKIFSLFRVSTALPILYGNNTFDVPAMDERGAVFVQNVINGTSSANLMLAVTDDTDNQATTPLVAGAAAPQAVVSRLYGYDGAGNNWDRLRVAGNNVDAVAAETIGVLKQAAALYGFNGATFDRLLSQANNGDAVATSTLGLIKQAAFPHLFNGSTFDRERGSIEATALASAARAVTTASTDITSHNGRLVVAIIDITAAPGVDTLVMSIQGRDIASGKYYNIISTAVLGAVSTIVIVSNTGIIGYIPRTWRINVAHSGASSFTYSVGYSIVR